MKDGESVSGANSACNDGEINHQNIQKIEVTFVSDEDYIFFIKFTYRNGTKTEIGKENSCKRGRVETFVLNDDEQLLGCEMD